MKTYEYSNGSVRVPDRIEDWVLRLPILCGPWWKFKRHAWTIGTYTSNYYFSTNVPEFCCITCGSVTSNLDWVKGCKESEIKMRERSIHDTKYAEDIIIGKATIAGKTVNGDKGDFDLVNNIKKDRNLAILHVKNENAYIRSVAMEYTK
jgi:hypothetical protein